MYWFKVSEKACLLFPPIFPHEQMHLFCPKKGKKPLFYFIFSPSTAYKGLDSVYNCMFAPWWVFFSRLLCHPRLYAGWRGLKATSSRTPEERAWAPSLKADYGEVWWGQTIVRYGEVRLWWCPLLWKRCKAIQVVHFDSGLALSKTSKD